MYPLEHCAEELACVRREALVLVEIAAEEHGVDA
jgi:hypothetical protein